MNALRRWRRSLTPPEWRRLGGLAAAVVALHAVGFGLLLAYGFGLRHAFDADHISAIDNTTRKMLQQGRRPLGVGFFFSLGHATIVLGLSVGIAVAASAVRAGLPAFEHYGGFVGAGVSGTFLLVLGILNLIVLVDIVKIAGRLRRGRYDEHELEERLLDRGFMNRFFLGRLFARIDESWHMYPVGLLFGLGFDTASEVGLLALTAGAASGAVPLPAILALPILFAAGMSMMDTADGVFMSQAYGWAFSSPVRRVYYNITVTALSVAVALLVGAIELVQVASRRLVLDFELLGYLIVALFAVTWVGATIYWKARRIEDRWSPRPAPESAPAPDC